MDKRLLNALIVLAWIKRVIDAVTLIAKSVLIGLAVLMMIAGIAVIILDIGIVIRGLLNLL